MTISAPHPDTTDLDRSAARVLVVDDEPAIRELLSLALRYEGWAVSTAASGAEAVAVACDVRPDVVLLDLMLPDLDGFTVLRHLRAEQPLLPVVFVTARDDDADRRAGLASGADDYLTKPFRLDDVTARLRRLLERG
ncbi:response regulator [Geodermatophilus sp. SYSU D00691]